MSGSNARRVIGTGDAFAAALPLDLLAERVNPEVLAALARWRDVDQYSLHDIAPALVTSNGVFIGESSGYLSALHGFVAEQITAEHFADVASTVLPASTTVPAIDLFVNGVPYQVKEGTTAYDLVHEAMARYPGVTHFVTDPETAARLNSEGVDAIGLDQLLPGNIETITANSVTGLDALERAGALHVPVLTTLFSICRYWEAYDAEQLSARTAIGRAVTDISAQAVGSAIGLKFAAIAVVATGGFAGSVLLLTAGSIAGALGLRSLIHHARAKPLRDAISTFELRRYVAEQSAEILVEHSRAFAMKTVSEADSVFRRLRDAGDRVWAARFRESLLETASDLSAAARAVLDDYRGACAAADYAKASLELVRVSSLQDPIERCNGLVSVLRNVISEFPEIKPALLMTLEHANRRADDRTAALEALGEQKRQDVTNAFRALRRQLTIDLFAEYALLLERLARIAAPVVAALACVEAERERIEPVPLL